MSYDPQKRRRGWLSWPAAMAIAIWLVPMSPGVAGHSEAAEKSAAAASDKGKAKDSHPRIVKTSPKQGATGVSPDVKQISVTFDRDMDQGMSWVGGPPLFPPVDESRKARWIDKRTCVLPVKLQEGAFYLVGINSPAFQNFRSKQGVPACTAAVYFSTKGATEEVEQRVRVPSIVSLEPENGAQEVDPGTTMLRVTFNVPMDEGMSWAEGGTTFPKIPEGKKASWSDDGLTCTLPVALEPGHDYQLGLNGVTHKNFTSKWGVPLEEVVYKFRTRSAGQGGGGPSPNNSSRAKSEEFDSRGIQGTVTDANGEPLAGAKITLNRFEGAKVAEDNRWWETTSDKDGRYELTFHVAKGQTPIIREVWADLQGYVRGAPALRLPLKDGKKGTVDFRLEKGLRLAGQLRLPLEPWERERPAESIVRVLEVSNPNFDKLTINARCHLVGADGAFEIYVPRGEYTLRALDYGDSPEWKGIKAPSDHLLLELQPFDWTKANVGKVFDDLWKTMDNSYSYFFLKPNLDWQALRDAHRPKIVRAQNAVELAAALQEMLATLNDMHVWIETPTDIVPTVKGGYVYNGNREITLANLRDTVPCGKFALVGKTKEDGFGYFLMLRQSDASPADVQAAVAAIGKLKDAPGFIVDLRSANGGSEPLASEIAQMFCARSTVYAKSKYRDGVEHKFGQVHGRILPATDDAYTRPVVCLIGPGAVSSGEGFVQMMKCLPQVTTVGLPTRGASGNPKPFVLSRTGLTVYFSSWVDMLPDGQPIEGVGIAPDTRVEAPDTSYATADPTLDKGLETLRTKVATAKPR